MDHFGNDHRTQRKLDGAVADQTHHTTYPAQKVWQQGCEALPPIDHGQEASRHGLMALPPIDPGHEASMVPPPIGNGHEANQQALRTKDHPTMLGPLMDWFTSASTRHGIIWC